jgi:hypothetical protein
MMRQDFGGFHLPVGAPPPYIGLSGIERVVNTDSELTPFAAISPI